MESEEALEGVERMALGKGKQFSADITTNMSPISGQLTPQAIEPDMNLTCRAFKEAL